MCKDCKNNCDCEKSLIEITEYDREAIAEDIKQGCNSGILDSETHRISWNINMNKFQH